MNPTFKGIIYVVKIDDGRPSPDRVKIGFTNNHNLPKRITSLRSGWGYPLTLLFTVPGNKSDERWLHSVFQSHRVPLKGNREWFFLRDDVARCTTNAETLTAYLKSKPTVVEAETAADTDNLVAEAVRRVGGYRKAAVIMDVSVTSVYAWIHTAKIYPGVPAVLLSRASGISVENLLGMDIDDNSGSTGSTLSDTTHAT